MDDLSRAAYRPSTPWAPLSLESDPSLFQSRGEGEEKGWREEQKGLSWALVFQVDVEVDHILPRVPSDPLPPECDPNSLTTPISHNNPD